MLEMLTTGHDHTRNDTMLATLGCTACLALVRLLSQQRFRQSAVFDFSRKTLTISQILVFIFASDCLFLVHLDSRAHTYVGPFPLRKPAPALPESCHCTSELMHSIPLHVYVSLCQHCGTYTEAVVAFHT